MFEGHSAVYPKIVFQVPEEGLEAVCIGRHIRLVDELEHIRQSPVYVDVCLPDAVMSIGQFSGLLVNGPFL